MNIFAERFLPLIENSGKSEQELEKAMELPRSIIYDWKNGRNKSSFMKYAGNFALYFGVSADYLLGLTDNPTLHSDDLSADEKRVLALFARLDDLDKGIIIGRMEAALEAEKYKQDGLLGEKAM